MTRVVLLAAALGAACTSGGDASSAGSSSDGSTSTAVDTTPTTTSPDASESSASSSDDASTCATADCCDDGCIPDSCDDPDACNGHGVCTEVDDGIACACDEGFTGDRCDAEGPDFHARTLLVPGLADPDVFAEHDDAFFLTGTQSTVTVPIYGAADLLAWELVAEYDPGIADPAHDYCNVWAPDLSQHDGRIELYFSAQRVDPGAPCPAAGTDVTTFLATAPDVGFAFGPPALVDFGAGNPASRLESGCGAAGCSRTVRIDSATFTDGVDRWLLYVWFEGGNNIASLRVADPGNVILAAGPAVFATAQYEESINEGPDVFLRDGRYHLFFSTGFFDSQYAMFHIVADDIADLTRARNVRRHSMPVRNAAGLLVESHGHNSLVQRRGEVFNVFHQGEFGAAGNLVGRSTYKQRIAFAPDGSIDALNFVDVRWSGIDGAQYSLDVVTRDGTVHGPCIAVGRIGSATSTRFAGICPDAGDVVVREDDIATFRVYWSTDGTWNDSVDLAYDGAADRVFVPIPDGRTREVGLRWNELQTTAEYSVDVQRGDGSWVAPCIGAPILGTAIEAVFAGTCTSAGVDVAVDDVQAFRVCSAIGGNWADATCGDATYDGEAGWIDVAIPPP